MTRPYVAAVGCPIPEAPVIVANPTYTRDIAPIVQKNCQECHRPGQVGPFALETYEQVRKRAADIASVVEDRAMPPWKASSHFGLKFKDERTLAEKDIATIGAWAEAGAPEGDPRDLPPASPLRRRLDARHARPGRRHRRRFRDPGLGR